MEGQHSAGQPHRAPSLNIKATRDSLNPDGYFFSQWNAYFSKLKEPACFIVQGGISISFSIESPFKKL